MADLGQTADIPIYTGVWTNYSRGYIAGATLTLSHRNGALLTTFLAIFVTFTGTSFWRILSFAFHQILSSKEPRDGLYHQTQAILRNCTTGVTGFMRLLYTLWAWRRKAKKASHRTLPLILIIGLCTAAFMAASILSAKISSGIDNEVLISSPSCGKLSGLQDVTNTTMYQTIFVPYLSKKVNTYANYVQNCYTNVPEAEGCGPFIKRKLPSTIDRNASCPFQNKICKQSNRNIKLDTGPLGFDTYFGFNLPPSLRYTFRYITHCAPLAAEGYKRPLNFSDDIAYMGYYYGQSNANSNETLNSTLVGARTNLTYEALVTSVSQLEFENYETASADYSLGYTAAKTYNGSINLNSSDFSPIDELFQPLEDSDLYLFFLSANSIEYANKVDDDWYAAHQPFRPFHYPIVGPEAVSAYLADEPASALGCTSQYQICRPGATSRQDCPSWGGILDSNNPIGPKASQDRTLFNWAISFIDLSYVASSIGELSLTARRSLSSGIQGALPNNQWQSDVEYWYNIGLASLQSVVDSAVGPADPEIERYFWKAPNSDVAKYLCKNQKIRSSAYSNFSVLGLVITLVVGGFIIITGYTLESVIDFMEKRLRKTKHSWLEWSVNDFLQMQRLAHEELGFGTWDGCVGARTVPVTDKDEKLAVLDTSDPQHLRLTAQTLSKKDGQAVRDIDPSSTQSESQPNGGTEILMIADDGRTAIRDETQTSTTSGEDELLDETPMPETIGAGPESNLTGERGDTAKPDKEQTTPSETSAKGGASAVTRTDNELSKPTEGHEASDERVDSS